MVFKNLVEFDCYKDGNYSFFSPKNFSIILKNFDQIEDSKKILVCFNAAVGDRKNKIGPFFSGLSIAEKLGVPIISISDYLVTNDPNLTLGWYAGDVENQDFQEKIANFLNKISEFFQKGLIIFGGSGGGFASLAIASKLKVDTHVLAINPQTSISNYFPNFVEAFLNSAYPDISIICRQCEEFLNERGVVNNVCNINYPNNISILYLQNKTDVFHIKNHLSNFIKNKEIFPWGDNSFTCNNIGIYLGGWGGGHKSPPVLVIHSIINLMLESYPINYILRFLENGANNTIPNINDFLFLSKADSSLKVYSEIKEGQVYTDVTLIKKGINLQNNGGILFALYALDDKNHVLSKTSYSKLIPNIPVIDGLVRVKVFAKDNLGKIIIGLSNKL